jgi:hypothetical protein
MKRLFPIVLRCFSLGLLAAGCAPAVPIACPSSGSFADLEATNADGGCLVGDKVFSDFTFDSSATGSLIALSETQFTYVTVVNAPSAIGFQFASAIGALPNSSMSIMIGWLVTSPNTDIQSNHLGFTASSFGNASASVQETYCKGGPVTGCLPANTSELSVFTGQGGTQLVDSDEFDPVAVLGIAKTIDVTAGNFSFANITNITQTVDQLAEIPEPATAMVMGCGLLALSLMRRPNRQR